MPPFGHGMISVDDVQGHVVSIHNIHNHQGEAGEGVVSVEFDGVHFEECLPCVDSDLAHIIRGMFWEVGIPHVIVQKVLLKCALRVGVGPDGGYSVKPGFLD